jgi:hypothetical protein
MQLLDDDMDELFRNAASQYPLKTGTGDWDALKNKLQQAENQLHTAAWNNVRDNRWYKAAVLLVLTSIFFIAVVPGLYNGELPVTDGASTVGVNIDNNIITENDVNRKISKKIGQHRIVNSEQTNKQTSEQTVSQLRTRTKTSEQLTTQTFSKKKNQPTTVSVIEKEESAMHHLPAVKRTSTAESITPVRIEKMQSIRYTDESPTATIAYVHMRNRPITAADSSTTTTPTETNPDIPVKKGIYAGIVLSPDITTVKMQRTSNIGYNVGLIAGYRISRKLALETGILWERKYYYSEGKYFSTKNIPIPSDTKVLDVDGWCNMYEIPLNIRYFFAANTKRTWYVNGGMSSYIMKKEAYNYKYETTGYVGNRDWEYRNATKDWFSVIHLGIGYEHTAGILGTLRVEPYIKIPAAGIGIGSMPVTSFGVNIGLTRSLY